MSESKTFFSAFPSVATEEWEAQIAKDLNGADYKDKLRWKSGEGINPLPFYRREDLQKVDHAGPVINSANRSWEVREAVYGATIKEANESAQQALSRGSDALQLSFHLNNTAGDNYQVKGLPLHNQTDFKQLLESIPLQKTSLHMDAGLLSPALIAMLWHEVQRQSINGNNIQGTLYYDPFAQLLQNGFLPAVPELSENLTHIASFCQRNLPHIRPFAIDGRVFHESGGTIVQELGFALATATEILAILTERNFAIDRAAEMVHFNFAIGSNYFLEIAKIRALRLLWENVLEAFEGNPEKTPAYIHAETSRWNKTVYDPYLNMLRTSTEGMSAAISGCDALTVLPFDEHFQQTDNFSQRIARNSQIIMREEAYLDKVQDPSAGSYYIEQLTHDLGREAWQLFQEVEARDGMLQAIEGGSIQSSIAQSRQQRDQAIARRNRIFVGTNQYPNPDERRTEEQTQTGNTITLMTSGRNTKSESRYSIERLGEFFAKGATLGDVAGSLISSDASIKTLQPYRGTQVFEELRLATEQSDVTPKVLNLPIGDPKIRKARSTFSNNFFGCAGYDIEDPIGFEDVSEAIDAIDEKQPEIAVLCSSDQGYEELVPALCEQLTGTEHRPLLVLAGYPEAQVETYQQAGIDLFIYSGCNALETLKNVQQKLSVIKN